MSPLVTQKEIITHTINPSTKRFLSALGVGILALLFSLFPGVHVFSADLTEPQPNVGANLAAYVPPAGSDCTINIPSQYSTIQAGVNAANSGDTVCVSAGTYNENVTLTKSIRLSGSGADQSVIIGASHYAVVTIAESAEDNIVVEGFTIIGTGTSPFDISVYLSGNSLGAIIQYNHIVSGNNGFALRVEGQRGNDLIQNNILEGINSNQVATIAHDGSSVNEQVVNNTFIGTVMFSPISDSGVVFGFGGTNGVVRQNVFNTGGTVYELMQIAYTPNLVTQNNFSSPTERVLRLSGGNVLPLDAENNWWGTTDPSITYYGAATIVGDVDYMPFALSPFPEYLWPPQTPTTTPTDIPTATSTITPTLTPVPFSFTGFFQPVDNLPTLNVMNAGRGVAVKFSLGRYQGIDIFAAGYPTSSMVVCGFIAEDAVEQTVTVGLSSLTYDTTTDQYVYVWNTDKAWASTCRTFVMKLMDGTYHRLNFKFK